MVTVPRSSCNSIQCKAESRLVKDISPSTCLMTTKLDPVPFWIVKEEIEGGIRTDGYRNLDLASSIDDAMVRVLEIVNLECPMDPFASRALDLIAVAYQMNHRRAAVEKDDRCGILAWRPRAADAQHVAIEVFGSSEIVDRDAHVVNVRNGHEKPLGGWSCNWVAIVAPIARCRNRAARVYVRETLAGFRPGRGRTSKENSTTKPSERWHGFCGMIA